jgi:hypothetical protein
MTFQCRVFFCSTFSLIRHKIFAGINYIIDAVKQFAHVGNNISGDLKSNPIQFFIIRNRIGMEMIVMHMKVCRHQM